MSSHKSWIPKVSDSAEVTERLEKIIHRRRRGGQQVLAGGNKANAFVLGVYALADALLAWLTVGAALNFWFHVVVFISAVVTAFLYNVWIMTFALRLEVEYP